ncbi:Uncharacterised protein [Mycobacteroides abscessus subsp. abscessus]|nr:Uncharacterised protein [Mycobacteroides abscessus subsp. abscessus]SKU27353.1 Uncharacterised protein [Mycobacteroides abscessus subsp. abscessus]
MACGTALYWPVCLGLSRLPKGSTRKPSAITDAMPMRGMSRASS